MLHDHCTLGVVILQHDGCKLIEQFPTAIFHQLQGVDEMRFSNANIGDVIRELRHQCIVLTLQLVCLADPRQAFIWDFDELAVGVSVELGLVGDDIMGHLVDMVATSTNSASVAIPERDFL